jgi:hypothetical protein
MWWCRAAFVGVYRQHRQQGSWLDGRSVAWLYDWTYFPSDANASSQTRTPSKAPMSWRRSVLVAAAALGLVVAGLWWIHPVLLEDKAPALERSPSPLGNTFAANPA